MRLRVDRDDDDPPAQARELGHRERAGGGAGDLEDDVGARAVGQLRDVLGEVGRRRVDGLEAELPRERERGSD